MKLTITEEAIKQMIDDEVANCSYNMDSLLPLIRAMSSMLLFHNYNI